MDSAFAPHTWVFPFSQSQYLGAKTQTQLFQEKTGAISPQGEKRQYEKKLRSRQALEMHAQGPLHHQERWSAPKKDRPAPASVPYLCVRVKPDRCGGAMQAAQAGSSAEANRTRPAHRKLRRPAVRPRPRGHGRRLAKPGARGAARCQRSFSC